MISFSGLPGDLPGASPFNLLKAPCTGLCRVHMKASSPGLIHESIQSQARQSFQEKNSQVLLSPPLQTRTKVAPRGKGQGKSRTWGGWDTGKDRKNQQLPSSCGHKPHRSQHGDAGSGQRAHSGGRAQRRDSVSLGNLLLRRSHYPSREKKGKTRSETSRQSLTQCQSPLQREARSTEP